MEDRGDAFKVGEIRYSTNAWAQNLLENNAPSYQDAYNIIHHTNLLLYKIDGLSFTNEADKTESKRKLIICVPRHISF